MSIGDHPAVTHAMAFGSEDPEAQREGEMLDDQHKLLEKRLEGVADARSWQVFVTAENGRTVVRLAGNVWPYQGESIVKHSLLMRHAVIIIEPLEEVLTASEVDDYEGDDIDDKVRIDITLPPMELEKAASVAMDLAICCSLD